MSRLLGAVLLGLGIAFAAFPLQILKFLSKRLPIAERSVSRVRRFGMIVIAAALLWMFFR